MAPLAEMIHCTKQLHQLFTDHQLKNDREQVIKKMHDLLDQRSEIIPLLQKPITEIEEKQTKQLMQLNESVQNEMDMFFKQLKKEMQTSKLHRKSNRSYTNPYKHIQVADGMFVDQKN